MGALAAGWKVERVPDPPFKHDLMCVTSPSGEMTAFTFADDSVVWQLLAAMIERPPLTAEQEAAVSVMDGFVQGEGCLKDKLAWQLLRPLIKGEG